jgi:Spy/CpxP family protein refolding chaperone
MSIGDIRKPVLAAAAAIALAAAGLLAGRISADAFPHGGRGSGDHAPRVFARMARALDLTSDQKTRIKAILLSHASEIEAQMQASAAARRALHDAIVAQPTDEGSIRSLAQDLGRVQGDGAVLFAKIRTEVDPILTTDQKQKIQTFRDRVGKRSGRATAAFDAWVKSGS